MSALKKLGLLVLVLTVLPAFGSGERLFAPRADLWDRWTAHDAGSTATIDHGAWDRFLAAYLSPGADGVARVDYAGVSAADKAALAGYIDQLAAVPVSTHNRDEQMAYWLNLYNALTVQVVVQHMPVASIRDIDISPGLLASGPWDKALVTVEGEALTLNDIEHRILRPIWNDPRIHYGVNCASIGCPNLAASAYTGVGWNGALDAAARAYVNHPRGVTVRGGDVIVSRIYDWFIEDFGGNEAGVLAHLKQYAKPDLAADLTRIGALSGTEYDWSLNAAR
jgi:hypothetical protein